MTTKKPFQIRRAPTIKVGTISHKHSETDVHPQLLNNALNGDSQRAYLNDVTPDIGTTPDDKRGTNLNWILNNNLVVINNEKLPKSAPVSYPKRVR